MGQWERMSDRGIKRYIGDRAFYRMVIVLVVPLIIQQGITNFVNLLDNVMVGRLGTESISGVAIVNQLIFVFNLSVFGALSGASIYGAQYAGVNDHDGVRDCLRFKLLIGAGITAAALLVFTLFGDALISLYLNDAENAAALALTRSEAHGYLAIALWGLLPFMVSQSLSGSLRETGETFAPMVTSAISVLINLVLNYILIYGKLGAPAMGVRGAALATVVARYVETAVLMVYALRRTERYPFIRGLFRSFRVPKALVKRISITGTPLLINEVLWSTGTAAINQCYSVRGLATVAAMNITTTAWTLFAVIMFSMGSAISILTGQRLGANDFEGARDVDRKLIAFTLVLHLGIGLIVILTSGLIPQIYNVEPEVRALVRGMLIAAGATLPLHALSHASYFTIRSGGRTLITLLFDSVYTWCVPLPMAFLLCRYTELSIVAIYAILQGSDALKLALALPILISGSWARNVIRSTAH